MSETSGRAGRACPLRYRYGAAAIGQAPIQEARTLYVIGGLYGNLPALDAIEALAAAEDGPVTLCFNGDFNWFNVDPAGFSEINERVLRHSATLGNVEAELFSGEESAGCGCAYPEDVGDAFVERSNRIHARLKATAARFPDVLQRLSALPMVARFRVGGCRVGVVHGDADSLAGWRFDAKALDASENGIWLKEAFHDAQVDVFASSHTCLPALRRFASGRVINNGASGLPNFHGSRHGVLTRIGIAPPVHAALYGSVFAGVQVHALPVAYDHAAWEARFLANWPPESDAWQSYYRRIMDGPDYSVRTAAMASSEYPECYAAGVSFANSTAL